jgi:hypothetical protein
MHDLATSSRLRIPVQLQLSVIDHGSSSRVLWFMPTRELCTDLMRSDLIPALQRQIDNHSRLSSFIDAQRYVAALKEVSALND